MCGIFFCLSESEDVSDEILKHLKVLLKNRGPDHFEKVRTKIQSQNGQVLIATFVGSVLWLRGEKMTRQPLSDEEGNILLWNGDIFDFDEDLSRTDSDTEILHKRLKNTADDEIPQVIFFKRFYLLSAKTVKGLIRIKRKK